MVINKESNAGLNCGVHQNCHIGRCNCNKFYVINAKTHDFPYHWKSLKHLRRKTSDKINKGINCVREKLTPSAPVCPRCSGLCQNINSSDCFITKRFSDAFVEKVNTKLSHTFVQTSLEKMPCTQLYENYEPGNTGHEIQKKRSICHNFLSKLCGGKERQRNSPTNYHQKNVKPENCLCLYKNHHGELPNSFNHSPGVMQNDYINICGGEECCCCCPYKFGKLYSPQKIKNKTNFTQTEPVNRRCCNCCARHCGKTNFPPAKNPKKPDCYCKLTKSETSIIQDKFLTPGRNYHVDPPSRDQTYLLSSVCSTIIQINNEKKRKLQDSIEKNLYNSNLVSPELTEILAKYSVEDLERAVLTLEKEKEFQKHILTKKVKSHDINIKEARKLGEKVKKDRIFLEISATTDDDSKHDSSSPESNKS